MPTICLQNIDNERKTRHTQKTYTCKPITLRLNKSQNTLARLNKATRTKKLVANVVLNQNPVVLAFTTTNINIDVSSQNCLIAL